jgi:large-conductance mechanosensitive channel
MAKSKTGKIKQLWLDFKKFISRGSVIDMAIGVVVGGAFNAIVNSVVNVLMSLSTWAVPGGINGLVTVLPAMTDVQKGIEGIGQTIGNNPDALTKATEQYAQLMGQTLTSTNFMEFQTSLLSKYTLYGDTYVFSQSAIINWGAVINAVISFLIIALTLFIVLKVYSTLKAKRAKLQEKLLEEYYKKNPDKRPVVETGEPAPAPVVEVKPEPKEIDYLKEIATSLKTKGRSGRRHH